MSEIQPYFQSIGFPMPVHNNPAEFLLELVNVDFSRAIAAAYQQLDEIMAAWGNTPHSVALISASNLSSHREYEELKVNERSGTTKLLIPITLLHRNFIKSYRDVVAYGIRVVMYIGSTPHLNLHGIPADVLQV